MSRPAVDSLWGHTASPYNTEAVDTQEGRGPLKSGASQAHEERLHHRAGGDSALVCALPSSRPLPVQ